MLVVCVCYFFVVNNWYKHCCVCQHIFMFITVERTCELFFMRTRHIYIRYSLIVIVSVIVKSRCSSDASLTKHAVTAVHMNALDMSITTVAAHPSLYTGMVEGSCTRGQRTHTHPHTHS